MNVKFSFIFLLLFSLLNGKRKTEERFLYPYSKKMVLQLLILGYKSET